MAGDHYDNLPSALQDSVIKNIQIGGQIGRGANGKILEAKWEGIVVAVKEIHSIFMNEVSDLEFQALKRSFLRECEQSSRLRHPNIVRFFGIYHSPGARLPSLVMERLNCSLTNFLEETPPGISGTDTKISIIKDVALGLRYLHSHNSPIIHRDLSSNNVLLSEAMEGKIGDLGTVRLVDAKRQSKMTKAPGTWDFMPPEALEDAINIRYGKELDVFSFGCVMLHTLSGEWPTPSQAVIINPDTGVITGGRSEVERRSKHFEKIADRSKLGALISMVESCLSNLPKNRPTIVSVCDQLENEILESQLTVPALQQIQQKNAELQGEILRKDIEIQALTTALHDKDVALEKMRCEMSKLQVTTPFVLPQKVLHMYGVIVFGIWYRKFPSFSPIIIIFIEICFFRYTKDRLKALL